MATDGGLAAPAQLEVFTVGDYAVMSFPVPAVALPGGLSASEQDVVSAALRGASNGEIAHRRHASVRTVANQLRSACTKLGVSGRSELAAHAAGLRNAR